MINIWKYINNNFNPKSEIFGEEFILSLLDQDLSISPPDLALKIYFIQNTIIERYEEHNSLEVLQILSYVQRMFSQMEIYYSAKIGKNFKIHHGLGTVIGARVIIKDNCTIYQNVTLGDKGRNGKGRPVIDNNVTIYTGAKVLGDIYLGENCIVGANSLVLSSFEKNSIIAGTPAKLVKINKNE